VAGQVQKSSVDNLRSSDEKTVQVLVDDLLRLHIQRIETRVVADLFAVADGQLNPSLSADLKGWAARATREILDLPDGEILRTFLAEVAEIPAGLVPQRLRDAVAALAAQSGAETVRMIDEMAKAWEEETPTPVVLPIAKAKAAVAKTRAPAKARSSSSKTPAADVDPRRADYIRQDVMGTLARVENGIKESVLVGGIRHRSPFKDITDSEIKAELRKLEREGLKQKAGELRIKKTGERWGMR
jgi:hypothetical protein